MHWESLLARLGVAVLAGAVIGFERQLRNRFAGIRTNTLVSLGAAIFCLLSTYSPNDNSPNRVAAQIASGIGFIGAGVIMRNRFGIQGINTAATLWCSAGVGVLAGSGFVIPALAGSGAVLVVNLLIRSLVHRLQATRFAASETIVRKIEFTFSPNATPRMQRATMQLLNQMPELTLQSIQKTLEADQSVRCLVTFLVQEDAVECLEKLAATIGARPSITNVTWSHRLNVNRDDRFTLADESSIARCR